VDDSPGAPVRIVASFPQVPHAGDRIDAEQRREAGREGAVRRLPVAAVAVVTPAIDSPITIRMVAQLAIM
jgi:hypothetical protein